VGVLRHHLAQRRKQAPCRSISYPPSMSLVRAQKYEWGGVLVQISTSPPPERINNGLAVILMFTPVLGGLP